MVVFLVDDDDVGGCLDDVAVGGTDDFFRDDGADGTGVLESLGVVTALLVSALVISTGNVVVVVVAGWDVSRGGPGPGNDPG